jgi:hypothetical protein
MKPDPIRRLVAADPVSAPPEIESPERLRCLIEQEGLSPTQGCSREAKRGGAPRRMLLGSLLAAGVCVALLLFDGGSPSPGVNVGAEAYAAITPKSGIVEAVFIAHSFGARGGEILRQQEWQDSATHQIRELDTLQEPGLDPSRTRTQITDWSFSPRVSEEWGGTLSSSSIRRERIPAGTRFQLVVRLQHQNRTLIKHIAFAGIGMYGIESLDLFRQLYRRGWMRLAGHERGHGRSLWRLESRPVGARGTSTRLVVLVDPSSFLPVLERQLSLSDPSHPRVLVENELVRYRTIKPGSPSIFDLAAQHPGAPVVVRKPKFPRFVRLHPKNSSACPCYGIRGLRSRVERR